MKLYHHLFIKSINTGHEDDNNQTGLANKVANNLDLKSEGLLSIYPNPSNHVINLIYLSSSNEMIKIEITDLSGRTLYQKDYAVNQGLNSIEIATSLVSGNGFVIINLYSTHQSLSRKLIIST